VGGQGFKAVYKISKGIFEEMNFAKYL